MAKRKQNKPRKQVKRQTRKFQLRVGEGYEQDKHVGEILDYARSQRREVTLIREAVALFWALENGNLEALYEKFPQYKGQVSGGGAGGGGLEELNAKLELLLSQATSGGYVMQSSLPAMKPVEAAPPVAFVQQAAPASAEDIADNFLNAFL